MLGNIAQEFDMFSEKLQKRGGKRGKILEEALLSVSVVFKVLGNMRSLESQGRPLAATDFDCLLKKRKQLTLFGQQRRSKLQGGCPPIKNPRGGS